MELEKNLRKSIVIGFSSRMFILQILIKIQTSGSNSNKNTIKCTSGHNFLTASVAKKEKSILRGNLFN